MNNYLNQLVSLAKIDNQLDDFEPKIEKIKSSLEKLKAEEEEINSDIDLCKRIKLEEELNNRKSELHIVELNEKLEEISKKSANVKTQREAKALVVEEEITREKIRFANEEIERICKIIENKEIENEKLEEDLKVLRENIAVVSAEVNEKLSILEEERTKVYQSKNELVEKIPQKIFEFYQKIKKWAKNTTVVPVRKQACYGCFLKIDNNNYAEIIKGEDIRNCPHCGRILYIETVEE